MSAVASDAGEQTLIGISTDAVNVIILLTERRMFYSNTHTCRSLLQFVMKRGSKS